MPSTIEICNLSLSRIGQGSINDLAEKSPAAKYCSLHYPNTKDSLLREFPWNFSTRNILLSQLDQTVPGWAYVYQYPVNALWVRKVFIDGFVEMEVPNEYEIVSSGSERLICCDLYQAYAKCTIRIEDPSLFDPLFVEALSYRLALDLSMPLTNSSTRTEEVMAKYQQAMLNAKMAGAVEGDGKKADAQKPKSVRSYLNARR